MKILNKERELMIREDKVSFEIRRSLLEIQRKQNILITENLKIKKIFGGSVSKLNSADVKEKPVSFVNQLKKNDTWRVYNNHLSVNNSMLKFDKSSSFKNNASLPSIKVNDNVDKSSKLFQFINQMFPPPKPLYVTCERSEGLISQKLVLVNYSINYNNKTIPDIFNIFQLKRLRHERKFQFRLLNISTEKFHRLHDEIGEIRDKLVKSKIYTRSERKAIVKTLQHIEGELSVLRELIVSTVLLLYVLCIEEINLYLKATEGDANQESESRSKNCNVKNKKKLNQSKSSENMSKILSKEKRTKSNPSMKISNRKNFLDNLDEKDKKAKFEQTFFKFVYPVKFSQITPELPRLKLNYADFDDILSKSNQMGWERFPKSWNDYKFIEASLEAIDWYRNKFQPWMIDREDIWKRKNKDECISFLQRIKYLLGTESSYYTISDSNTEITKLFESLDIFELRELVSYRSQLDVKLYEPISQTSINYNLDSNYLDQSIGKHPASIIIKLLVYLGQFSNKSVPQNFLKNYSDLSDKITCFDSSNTKINLNSIKLLVKESRNNAKNAGIDSSMSRSDSDVITKDWIDFEEYVDNLKTSVLDKLNEDKKVDCFYGLTCSDKISFHKVIKFEVDEIHSIISALFDNKNQLLRLKEINQKYSLVIDDKIAPHIWVKIIKTPDIYTVEFPTWMQPSYRFGSLSPIVPYKERLAIEISSGETNGKYAKMFSLEGRVNSYAIQVVKHLKVKRLVSQRKKELSLMNLENAKKKINEEIFNEEASLQKIEKKLKSFFIINKSSLIKKRWAILENINNIKNKLEKLLPETPSNLSQKEIEIIRNKVDVIYSMSTISPRKGWVIVLEHENQQQIGDGDGYGDDQNNTLPTDDIDGLFQQDGEVWVFGGFNSPCIYYRVMDDIKNNPRGSIFSVSPGSHFIISTHEAKVIQALRGAFNSRNLCFNFKYKYADYLVHGRFTSEFFIRRLNGQIPKETVTFLRMCMNDTWKFIKSVHIEKESS